MAMKEDTAGQARRILNTAPGAELDIMLSAILFGFELEKCGLVASGLHLAGSVHHKTPLEGKVQCTSPLPPYSTDWTYFPAVLEWVTLSFPCVEIIWDCNRWMCNLNFRDKAGKWFRITHTPGSAGLQEAICKAGLLALVSPQEMPLDVRFVVAKDLLRKPKLFGRKTKRKI